MLGLKIFALYSFPPQRFGFCGAGKERGKEIFDFLLGKEILEIEEIMKNSKAAHFYCQLIAKENKIPNSFNKKVVRAYWIGNKLLEKVRLKKLKEMVKKNFKKPKLANLLPKTSRVHHSFHVLVTGPIDKTLILTEGMKDLCKISWGKVLKILNSRFKIGNLIVEYQPLLREKIWFLGKPQKRKIFWHKKILPKLKVGDFVSFHWDFVCEKLSQEDLENLKKYTSLSIQVANFLAFKES
jgi:hypothetical protein